MAQSWGNPHDMNNSATAGIGHNGGPSANGAGFRAHCWRVARAELLGARLPIEVVRSQVARAKALGLDYKTYAGVRSTTGRDLVAFLYSSNALGVFRDGQALAPHISARVVASAAARHLGTSPGVDPDLLGRRLETVAAIPLPQFGASWTDMRVTMKAWLKDQRLAGDSVLMIGETDHEREIMAAAGLAGFVAGQAFFDGHSHAV